MNVGADDSGESSPTHPTKIARGQRENRRRRTGIHQMYILERFSRLTASSIRRRACPAVLSGSDGAAPTPTTTPSRRDLRRGAAGRSGGTARRSTAERDEGAAGARDEKQTPERRAPLPGRT